MNESRNIIHNKSTAVHCGVCGLVLSSFIVQVAYADVGLPPPAVHQTTNNGFPSSQALKNQGYDPSTGVLRVSESNRGSSTVVKNGDTITGQQQKTVTATGKYGEKATMSTAVTQKTSVSKLNTIANAAVIGSIAGQNQTQNANKLGSQIAQGDFSGAASTAVNMAGQALNNILGGIPNGIAEGFSGMADLRRAADSFNKEMYGGSPSQQASQLNQAAQQAAAQQAQAERNGDLGGAIGNAAAAKAAQGAAEVAQSKAKFDEAAQKQNENGLYPVQVIFKENTPNGSYYSNQIYYSHLKTLKGGNNGSRESFGPLEIQIYAPEIDGKYVSYKFKDPNSRTVNVNWSTEYSPNAEVIADNMSLNSKDVQEILKRMLESQQTNHKELMNQLSKIGDSVEQATTSKEWTTTTALSEPYTPQGSNTPQQTRFEIDKNGNVTTTIVPRPDLKPNSSQAPTRTVVIPNKADTGQQTPTNQTGQQTGQEQGTGQQTPTNQTGQQTGQEQGSGQQTPTNQTGQQTGSQQGTTTQTGSQQNPQQQEQKNFCEQNPNSAACADLGEADYEDLSIPEQTIDLSFKPSDYFSTNGTCPSPRTVDFGMFGSHVFSYELLCDFAAKIRPILIAITILSCAWFVSGSLKEV